jgi:hypothetical protein
LFASSRSTLSSESTDVTTHEARPSPESTSRLSARSGYASAHDVRQPIRM